MCGITGILNYNQAPINKEHLLYMNQAMVLRGPDDSGYYIDHNFGMAMRRLSIIDLDGGQQPIANETSTIHVVLNGEIYNYLELRTDLEKRGYHFSTQSDTEVLVHLYEEYGTNAVQYLNGMFAFAIWDAPRKRLWVVRDRLGIKPLVYFESSHGFVFASDLNALARHPAFIKDVDMDSLLMFLTLAYIPTPRTIWKNAKKLPPGHWILIEKNNLIVKKYWQLNPLSQSKYNQEDYIEKIDELFHQSIELRGRSDVPVGTFLSGGLDSSSITALFCQRSNKNIHTFCMDFEGKDFNEGYFAQRVANRYNTIHHPLSLNLSQALAELDELLPLMDEPMADSAIIPSYILSKNARQNNIPVMLSGAGGDELFGGYGRHYPNKYNKISGKLPLAPISLWYLMGKTISRNMMHYGIVSWDKGLAFGVGTSGIHLGYLDYLTNGSKFFKSAIELTKNQFSDLRNKDKKYGHSYGCMLTDIQNYLVDNVLAITDKTSMAASIEARVPLLDHNLVEMVFSVQSSINIGTNGFINSKQTLKKISERLLPDEILNRQKVGFNAPVNSWIHSGNEIIEERVKNLRHPALAEIFNRNSISNLWDNPKKRKSASESIFMIYILDKWLEIHA
jgi:asparagine synthase (glutamine-hydrolysing)